MSRVYEHYKDIKSVTTQPSDSKKTIREKKKNLKRLQKEYKSKGQNFSK